MHVRTDTDRKLIYEIRLYTIVPGRMDVHHERFRNHLPRLFERHGIKNVGRWTTAAGTCAPMFIYMMAYADLTDRECQWKSFYQDKQWLDIRQHTQGAEEVTERFDLYFLRTNSIWTPSAIDGQGTLGGVHDLIFAEIALGKAAETSAFLSESYLPAIQKAGARIMLVADFISGPALPKIAIMIAWPEITARSQGWEALWADPLLNITLAEQRRHFRRPLLGRTDMHLLIPTPYALPLATLGNPSLP